MTQSSSSEKVLSNGLREQLSFLDGLRGLAALYVAVHHSRWLLWEGYSLGCIKHPDFYTPFVKVISLSLSVFKYGHEAVLFFFVLSGFVIHLRYSRILQAKGKESSFDLPSYLWRRARRIYPPLLAALCLTYLLDSLGERLDLSIYRGQTPYAGINDNVGSIHGWKAGLGNLALLMKTYGPVWGTNGPLWSLKFEWWFYMMYPALWFITRRSIGIATVLVAVFFVMAYQFEKWPIKLLHDISTMLIIWWLGALLADVFVGRLRISLLSIAPLSLGTVVLPFLNLPKAVYELGWGLGFCGILAGCLWLTQRNVALSLLGILKPLGEMSYSLYVLHFPILVLMSGILMKSNPKGELPFHFGWVPLGTIVSLGVAYGAHFIVERPFLSGPKKAVPTPEASGG